MTAKYFRIKRILDVTTSSIGLLLLSPVLLGVAIAVRIKLGTPVLFAQERPGLDGESFKLLKFRTMMSPDASRGLITDGDRLTLLGTWLRSTSLDELPSLANVLRGEMSIVGPRPLLVAYLSRYTSTQARRHEVRPGITGLAQVNGRNNLPWDEKFELDIQYVDNISFKSDLIILFKTIKSVVQRTGIAADGHPTNFEFEGTENRDRALN